MVRSYVAVDIETTGLSPVKDKIIEIGAVKVVEGNVVATFSKLIDPKITLNERIVELTGITDDMLVGQSTIEKVIFEFIEFVNDLPLLGHNVSFDYSFLKTAAVKEKLTFERNGIDTLNISRILHGDRNSKTLDSMCSYYGIINENHHRAYDDAIAAMRLYEKLALCERATPDILAAKQLIYKPKKVEPITAKQKNYLIDLLKYHRIELRQPVDSMTKSEASRTIDNIQFRYGKKQN